MPPATQLAGAAGFEIDRATHTIRFERDFDAPAALVFEAWTRPKEVAAWWDPEGQPLAACTIDLRPGGAFAFVSRSHPEMPFGGTYSEIDPPNLLVFEATGATGRVRLAETGGGTHMTVEIACRSAEHLDQYLQMGVHRGTDRTLNNLVAHVSAAHEG
ncbi:MAG: SRPBCC domain-containing protein [Pseudomonadota bacterium]